jgi:Domain of unknown function (DUF4397)
MTGVIRKTTTVTAAAAIGLAGTIALSAPAQARTAGYAEVRAAHFSPTTPGVDVYLSAFSGGTSTQWLSGVRYGGVSPYRRLAAGLYTIAMRPHGAAKSTKPMLSWTLNAKSGGAYTVAGVGAGSSVRGVVISDNLSTPPKGTGRVRVIQASSRAPIVTVRATAGPVIASRARFATTTGYATVKAGTWKLQVQSDGATPPLTATGSVDVTSGGVTSVLLLDSKSSGITVRTLLDAAGTAKTPKGAVSAGGGGLAAVLGGHGLGASSSNGFGLAGTVVLLLAAAGVTFRRTPRRLGAHAER